MECPDLGRRHEMIDIFGFCARRSRGESGEISGPFDWELTLVMPLPIRSMLQPRLHVM